MRILPRDPPRDPTRDSKRRQPVKLQALRGVANHSMQLRVFLQRLLEWSPRPQRTGFLPQYWA